MKRSRLSITNSIISPYNVINFAESLFKSQLHPITREDYILANTKLLNNLGTSNWLSKLIEALTGKVKNKSYAVINPIETVKISTKFQGQHQTIINLNDWLNANSKLIEELGAEQWLSLLLDILKN